MFFGFDSMSTQSSDYRSFPLQIWETVELIKSPLMVCDVNPQNNYKSDLGDCYRCFYGDSLYYLDVKSRRNPKRSSFLNFLKKNHIYSWITPVNENALIELHLFSNDNSKLIRFVGTLENEDFGQLLEFNSFEYIKEHSCNIEEGVLSFSLFEIYCNEN